MRQDDCLSKCSASDFASLKKKISFIHSSFKPYYGGYLILEEELFEDGQAR